MKRKGKSISQPSSQKLEIPRHTRSSATVPQIKEEVPPNPQGKRQPIKTYLRWGKLVKKRGVSLPMRRGPKKRTCERRMELHTL